jgi:hypothetical protein
MPSWNPLESPLIVKGEIEMLAWYIGGCVLFGVAVIIIAIACGAPSLDTDHRE